MGADSLAENTLNRVNTPEFICPICLPNPKFWISMKKGFIGRPKSVARIFMKSSIMRGGKESQICQCTALSILYPKNSFPHLL